MAFPYKKLDGTIKKFTQEQKDAAAYGAEGALGLVGGFAGKAVKLFKTFGNTAKQYMSSFKKPTGRHVLDPKFDIKKEAARYDNVRTNVNKLVDNLNQQTIRPLHRDGKVYDRKAINDAFKRYFNR